MGKLTIKKWRGSDVRQGICFTRDNDILDISFAGNLDLYFTFTSDCNHTSFIIGKDNYEVWKLFDKLYHDVINAQVFEFTEQDKKIVIIFAKETKEDYHQKLKEEEASIKELNESLKKHDAYKNLVDGEDIKWCSDDFSSDIAPYFIIKPINGNYEISFGIPTPQRKSDWEEQFQLEGHKHGTISIRLRNSGSHFSPFNNVFMKLFNSLMRIDLEEEYHQIHIEEYLSSRTKTDMQRVLKK